MATSVWLDDSECTRDGRLPPVCLKCGDPAHQTVRRTFSWVPSWTIVFLLIGWPIWLILTLVLTKKMVVYAPLCPQHEGIFARRKLISTLLVLLALGSFFGAIVFGAVTQEQNKQ